MAWNSDAFDRAVQEHFSIFADLNVPKKFALQSTPLTSPNPFADLWSDALSRAPDPFPVMAGWDERPIVMHQYDTSWPLTTSDRDGTPPVAHHDGPPAKQHEPGTQASRCRRRVIF